MMSTLGIAEVRTTPLRTHDRDLSTVATVTGSDKVCVGSNRNVNGKKADRSVDTDRPLPPMPLITTPGLRAETMPPSISNASTDIITMLNGMSIPRPLSQSSTSSRFREHLADLDDTWSYTGYEGTPMVPSRSQTDSPTLGRGPESPPSTTSLADEVRRKQHLGSWTSNAPTQLSHYTAYHDGLATRSTPRTPPSTRNAGQASPAASSRWIEYDYPSGAGSSADRGRFQ